MLEPTGDPGHDRFVRDVKDSATRLLDEYKLGAMEWCRELTQELQRQHAARTAVDPNWYDKP